MSTERGTADPFLFVERGFLDPAALDELFAAVRASSGRPATVYGRGDYFVTHQDGNTGLLRSEREGRKVSAVIFHNSQTEEPETDTHGGGTLVFHPRHTSERLRFPGEAGTRGKRFTIASWYK